MRRRLLCRLFTVVLVLSALILVPHGAVVGAASNPEAEAAALAPGTPFETVIANDVAYRKSLGFRSDEDYVRWVYSHPEITTRSRGAGALFTISEAEEERLRREDLPADAEAVEGRLKKKGLSTAIGGIFIDHESGGMVTVLLTRSVDEMRLDLSSVVKHPERLAVKSADHTEAALNDALNRIDYQAIVAKTGPVRVAAVDIVHNRLELVVDDPDSANKANAGAGVGVRVAFVAGASASAEADRNSDSNVPPYRGGHGIRLYASSTPSGTAALCTMGFAAYNLAGHSGAFTAGHCGESGGRWSVFHNDAAPVYIGTPSGGFYAHGGSVDYYAYTGAANKTTSPTVFTNWPSTIKVRATDEGHEKVGYTRIKSGRTTGYGNGVLKYTNVDIDGSGTKYSGGWRAATYAKAGGDSGMPVWHPLNGYAWASGIHGGAAVSIGSTSYGYYSYIRYVLDASGYRLKTTT